MTDPLGALLDAEPITRGAFVPPVARTQPPVTPQPLPSESRPPPPGLINAAQAPAAVLQAPADFKLPISGLAKPLLTLLTATKLLEELQNNDTDRVANLRYLLAGGGLENLLRNLPAAQRAALVEIVRDTHAPDLVVGLVYLMGSDRQYHPLVSQMHHASIATPSGVESVWVAAALLSGQRLDATQQEQARALIARARGNDYENLVQATRLGVEIGYLQALFEHAPSTLVDLAAADSRAMVAGESDGSAGGAVIRALYGKGTAQAFQIAQKTLLGIPKEQRLLHLASLGVHAAKDAYTRLPDAPALGFSLEELLSFAKQPALGSRQPALMGDLAAAPDSTLAFRAQALDKLDALAARHGVTVHVSVPMGALDTSEKRLAFLSALDSIETSPVELTAVDGKIEASTVKAPEASTQQEIAARSEWLVARLARAGVAVTQRPGAELLATRAGSAGYLALLAEIYACRDRLAALQITEIRFAPPGGVGGWSSAAKTRVWNLMSEQETPAMVSRALELNPTLVARLGSGAPAQRAQAMDEIGTILAETPKKPGPPGSEFWAWLNKRTWTYFDVGTKEKDGVHKPVFGLGVGGTIAEVKPTPNSIVFVGAGASSLGNASVNVGAGLAQKEGGIRISAGYGVGPQAGTDLMYRLFHLQDPEGATKAEGTVSFSGTLTPVLPLYAALLEGKINFGGDASDPTGQYQASAHLGANLLLDLVFNDPLYMGVMLKSPELWELLRLQGGFDTGLGGLFVGVDVPGNVQLNVGVNKFGPNVSITLADGMEIRLLATPWPLLPFFPLIIFHPKLDFYRISPDPVTGKTKVTDVGDPNAVGLTDLPPQLLAFRYDQTMADVGVKTQPEEFRAWLAERGQWNAWTALQRAAADPQVSEAERQGVQQALEAVRTTASAAIMIRKYWKYQPASAAFKPKPLSRSVSQADIDKRFAKLRDARALDTVHFEVLTYRTYEDAKDDVNRKVQPMPAFDLTTQNRTDPLVYVLQNVAARLDVGKRSAIAPEPSADGTPAAFVVVKVNQRTPPTAPSPAVTDLIREQLVRERRVEADARDRDAFNKAFNAIINNAKEKEKLLALHGGYVLAQTKDPGWKVTNAALAVVAIDENKPIESLRGAVANALGATQKGLQAARSEIAALEAAVKTLDGSTDRKVRGLAEDIRDELQALVDGLNGEIEEHRILLDIVPTQNEHAWLKVSEERRRASLTTAKELMTKLASGGTKLEERLRALRKRDKVRAESVGKKFVEVKYAPSVVVFAPHTLPAALDDGQTLRGRQLGEHLESRPVARPE